jgi:hypothetical protein
VLQSIAAVNATSDGHRLSDGEGCIIEGHGGGGGDCGKILQNEISLQVYNKGEY